VGLTFKRLHPTFVAEVSGVELRTARDRATRSAPAWTSTRSSSSAINRSHSVTHSRWMLGFEFSEEEQARLPGTIHPIVRTFPRSGRRSLYVASHISRIVDWPLPEGRLLVHDLMEHATRPERVYRHAWRVGDLVIWDNRATMHRACPFDDQHHRRELRRVTTLDVSEDVVLPSRAR